MEPPTPHPETAPTTTTIPAGQATAQSAEDLVRSAADGLALLGPEGTVVAASAAMHSNLGRTPGGLLGEQLGNFVHPSDAPLVAGALRDTRDGSEPIQSLRVTLDRAQNDPLEAELLISALGQGWTVHLHPVAVAAHSPHRMASLTQWQLGVHELISSGATSEVVLENVCRLVDHHLSATCIVTLRDSEAGRMVTTVVAAPGLEALVGAHGPSSSPESYPTTPGVVTMPRLSHVPLLRHLAEGGHHPVPGGVDPDSSLWTVAMFSPTNGLPLGRVAAIVNSGKLLDDWAREVLAAAARLAGLAAERRRADLTVRQEALFDPLTGLPRRGLFFDRVSQALRRSTPSDWAVFFVQLADLHLVNTGYGTDAGDLTLVEAKMRLEAAAGHHVTVARFGGDEFAVLASSVSANDLSAKIHESFTATCTLETSDGPVLVHPRVLVGVALGDPTDDAHTLCRKAQTALRWAHQPTSASTVVYNDARRMGSVERLSLRGDLQRCVNRGELRIDYQPKIDLLTGEICGAEALVRWHHPIHGLLRPDQFIALAEESGVIVDIGEWVLSEAVNTAAQWRLDDVVGSDFLLAVNLSARQLWSPVYDDHVGNTLANERWPAEQLSLELTETLLVSNYDELLTTLGALKRHGVLLAADDFGTGYSALAYLDELPLDILKIDKGFVARLRSDGSGSVASTGVVSMAKQLKLRTCGEGVETPEQLAGLRSLGCDWAQGYLIAQPLAPDQFAELATTRPRW